MAQQAREMARIVREQSRQGPVNSTSTPPQFPFDPNLLRNTAENIANSFFLTIAVIAIGIPLVRAIGRRFGPAPAPAVIPPAMTDQLHRIETAVESMAIEIERISESQRFLAKLQTGKSEMAALPRSGAGGA